MKLLSDARPPVEPPSCVYCRMGAPDLCRCPTPATPANPAAPDRSGVNQNPEEGQ